MFTLLEDKKEIASAQRELGKTIETCFKKSAIRDIGYPSGTNYDAKVRTDGKHWFWSGDLKKKTPNPRKLNWFGVFNEDRGLQITVEINTLYEGETGKVAGFFARNDEDGTIYLMHSGRVGGGTVGVGKSAFLAWSNHPLVLVVGRNRKARKGIVVMPARASGAIRSAIRYVDTIVSFKEAVREGKIETIEFQEKLRKFEEFYSESSGRRKGRRKNKIDYYSRHGNVVDALYQWRYKQGLKKDSRIVKNVQIDLGVETNGILSEVYEVKTSSTRTVAYTALGQLMVHSANHNCKKFLVLPTPSNLPTDIKSALTRLGIAMIEFDLSKSDAWIMCRF